MKLEEVLTSYRFNNVGQFKGIAQSLGYREEYNNGYLCFTKGDEKFRLTVDKIRSFSAHEQDLTSKQASMERICKFFNKDGVFSPDYEKNLFDKEEISIINWGDIGSDSKDRFTMIDHKNRICYTGKEFYDYALQNGYLLDGQGTKLEKGVLSDMREVRGKPAKIRLTENGVSVFYKKETLVIPDRILGKKLSDKQKKNLLEGEMVVLPAKKGDIFVQVDRDLNSVIVRSEKEMSIPSTIGGRELTVADKYLLVNGHSLDNMILHGENGYFIADVSWTNDKRGVIFSNIQNIPESKALQLLETQQQKDYVPTFEPENVPLPEQQNRDREAELKEAIEKDDFETMSRLKDEGYKPSEEVINGLSHHPNMDDKKAVVIEKLFGTKPEIQKVDELSPAKEEISEEVKQEVAGETKEIAKKATPEQDVEFKTALVNGDFVKLDMLKNEGYAPSKEVMQSMAGSVPENSLVAAHKIFGLKSTSPTLGDVKLAQSSKPSNTKEVARGVGNVINKAFGDL